MSQLTLQDALNQAVGHHQAGRLQDAEKLYRLILGTVPEQPDALHLLGVIAHQVGKHDAAIELIEKSLKVFPNYATAHNNLGEAYRAFERPLEAETNYRRAIELEPGFTAAHSNLGIVLHTQRKLDEAAASYRKALDLQPDFVEAMNNLGNVWMDLARYDDAVTCYRGAMAINPQYAAAVNNLGAALERSDKLIEATDCYRKATEIQPTFAEAWNNLGSIMQKRQDFPAAMAFWKKTTEVNPQHPDANWNLGLAALALGDYAQGWLGYEWRWRCSHSRHYWREYPGKTRWNGSPLNGKAILLFPEQGFGDVIQFSRFVKRVADLGGRVILECHPELVSLMQTLEGVVEVVPQHGTPVTPFDTYLALLSVPLTLGVRVEDVGKPVPYLRPDAAKVEAFKAKFASYEGKKVGLVWAGKTHPDPKRTCPFEKLKPLIEMPGVTFVSLQKGDPVADLAKSPFGEKIVNLDAELNSFADTAAAIAALDLVITIDTAVCHLAGAIGAPVWTLLPGACDWRWMLERSDNPWYPSMRLYRQPKLEVWEPMIAQVAADLKTHFS